MWVPSRVGRIRQRPWLWLRLVRPIVCTGGEYPVPPHVISCPRRGYFGLFASRGRAWRAVVGSCGYGVGASGWFALSCFHSPLSLLTPSPLAADQPTPVLMPPSYPPMGRRRWETWMSRGRLESAPLRLRALHSVQEGEEGMGVVGRGT